MTPWLIHSECVSGDISKLDMHGMCQRGISSPHSPRHDDVTCPSSKLGTDHDILELIKEKVRRELVK